MAVHIDLPHKHIIALQNLCVLVCDIGEKKFCNWFMRHFMKQHGGTFNQAQLKNLKDLAETTYRELMQIAAPLVLNANSLTQFDVEINFKLNENLPVCQCAEEQEENMDDLFNDIDFGDFNLES